MCDNTNRDRPMHRAIELSAQNMATGQGGPFGAVVVRDGKIIGEGANQVTTSNDPTAHAEICAIRAACKTLGEFSLEGCDLYTSCEPCPMCLAAAYWARLDHIYFANTRAQAAAVGFDDAFLYTEIAQPLDQRTLPIIRVELAEAHAVFEAWHANPDKVEY
ncbi:MAG: nucleoside deaminase [Alphaproteobacteria bacterium]